MQVSYKDNRFTFNFFLNNVKVLLKQVLLCSGLMVAFFKNTL